MVIPPEIMRSVAPLNNDEHPISIATNELEQAVSIEIAGPFKSNK